MSAGQQRRVMIARALVASAEMLLLDEPSNALDISAQRDLRQMLRGLAQQGTGILLITHHIADILPEIDRVLMMRDGRILADGPKHQLLTAARLGELFNTHVELAERDGFYNAW
jgi:iron complex transport system ATP-binding protein